MIKVRFSSIFFCNPVKNRGTGNSEGINVDIIPCDSILRF